MKKILNIMVLLITVLGFSACQREQEAPSVEFSNYIVGVNEVSLNVEVKDQANIIYQDASVVLYRGNIALQTKYITPNQVSKITFDSLEDNVIYKLEVRYYTSENDKDHNKPTVIATLDVSTSDENIIEEITKVKMEIAIGEYTGDIYLDIYHHIAPKTADNFINLVEVGFYNELDFHRVISGFLVQGGRDTSANLTPIEGEFSSNGFENSLSHERGVISMARTSDKNSATSQFFIMHQNTQQLDGQYAAFGKVTSGLEVVDKIAENPVNGEIPIIPVMIISISVI